MAFFPKQPSWRASILQLQLAENHTFPAADRNYIYTLLSGSVKQASPLSLFETALTEEEIEGIVVPVIKVERVR